MISAKIVADSIGANGIRLTTFVLTYPRMIHAEFMTHRVFSRNASSSRAIPVQKQIDMVISEPAIPLAFTKNQKGMQGGAALTGDEHEKAVAVWLAARDAMAGFAKQLADLEVHKQYANRLLEPFAHITVVATATDIANFYALRCHEMAQPEIHALADLMYAESLKSTPEYLINGQWHLPFITAEDVEETKPWARKNYGGRTTKVLIQRSVARCARVSYLNHDGTQSSIEQDMALYQRLMGAAPIHASPAEHQAKALSKTNKVYSGNLRGWTQYRKTVKGENVTKFDGAQ